MACIILGRLHADFLYNTLLSVIILLSADRRTW